MKATEERGRLWRELDGMTVNQQQRDTAYTLWAVYDLDTALKYLSYLKARPDAPVVRNIDEALQAIGVPA